MVLLLSCLLLLLLLQTILSYLLLLSLKMLWQINRTSHGVPPHRMELGLCHLIHPIWKSHRDTAVLLGQHSLSLGLLLTLLCYHLLLLHLQLRIGRDWREVWSASARQKPQGCWDLREMSQTGNTYT